MEERYLHVQMDTFLDMLPQDSLGAADGLRFEELLGDGHPCVRAFCGPAADRALSGMRLATAALAEADNNLIIDDVAQAREIDDYRRILESHSPFFVGLTAPLAVLEERERSRGDRMLGLAPVAASARSRGRHL